MSGKCDDCNISYIQTGATCSKNKDGIFQTKRFFRCPKCNTIYIEIDPLQDENYHKGVMVVEKHKPVEIKPPKEKNIQSKLW